MGKSKISWTPRPSEHNPCRVGQSGSRVMGHWDRVVREKERRARDVRKRGVKERCETCARDVYKRGSERGKRRQRT